LEAKKKVSSLVGEFAAKLAKIFGTGLKTQKFTVSHAGKQHSYHLAFALRMLDKLQGFYTSSYIEQAWLQKFIVDSGNQFFTRRFKEGLSAPFVHSHWSFELKETIMRKLQGKSLAVQNQVYQRDVDFDLMMAKKLPHIKSSHFWGFQGSCYTSLLAAKKAEKTTICELATAHVVQAKKILLEEAKLQPEWADSIDNLYFPPAYEKRLEEEPQRADLVIAASAFTKWTLIESGISDQKIKVLPLGFEAEKIPFILPETSFSKRPLRLLFAGTATQRKGISYLIEAMKSVGQTPDIELHIVGGIQGSGTAFWKNKDCFTYHPAVSQYEMFRLYQDFDALVLPTVFEGFGLVIVEAMAAGLPVITTSHSMGPDVIVSGKNGWLIPIRDPKAIENAILSLRNLNDGQYLQMRQNARDSALAFTWSRYAENLRLLCEKM
jgi:starch synthase